MRWRCVSRLSGGRRAKGFQLSFWPAIEALQQQHVEQDDDCGSEEYPAVTGGGRDRCAQQRSGDVTELHERLVITKNTAGDVIA